MLKRIVQQVSGQVMALYTQASLLVKEQLLPSASKLLVSITQAFQNVVKLFSQLVKTVLNIKALVASLITQVQSIKAALITAKAKALLIGQQLLTTVRPTSQPVATVQSQKTDKPAASTKLAQSRSKGSKTAQTRTAHQSTADGLKSAVAAKQPLQRATKQSKKGK